MKDDFILINTARGSVINTKDVVEGLKQVRLNDIPNVFITGHHAFLTEEALTNITDTTIYNLDCWNSGKETENELTELVEIA